LHKHNYTVYCDGNDSVWFGRDEGHRAHMTMVGWPPQTLAYMLRLLLRSMKVDALFMATSSGSGAHHIHMESVREMVACARWAAVMWILQYGLPAPGSEAAPSDGSTVTMREFMHRMVSAWVEVEVAPAVAVEDAPAVAVAVAPAVAVAVAVAVAAVAAEVEVEAAAVAVEDAPVEDMPASKPGGGAKKRAHKSGATPRKKHRKEVTPLKGLFDNHLLAVQQAESKRDCRKSPVVE
jgi:hypothetical protein